MGARLVVLGLLGVAAMAGCGETSPPPSAADTVQQLKAQGVPISKVETYTEENDPNKLQGRPGQYVGKANFRDRRAEDDGLGGLDVSEGGSIEVFASEGDAEERTAYVKAIGETGGPFAEYDYQSGQVLLRVAGNLTPKQAREYEAALGKVAP